jgi:hypothetical protein
VDFGGNTIRGRSRRTEVIEKGQFKSTRNRRACMRNLMDVEKAKDVFKEEEVEGSDLCLP